MSANGDTELLAATRAALLDAIEALREQRHAIVVIGAQAVYLHTGDAPVALAETTKDSDLVLDSRVLHGEPTIEHSMREAGFHLDFRARQPGAWLNSAGFPWTSWCPKRSPVREDVAAHASLPTRGAQLGARPASREPSSTARQ